MLTAENLSPLSTLMTTNKNKKYFSKTLLFHSESGRSLHEYKRVEREGEAAERLIICAIVPKTDDNQISAGSVANNPACKLTPRRECSNIPARPWSLR